ncbi:MAG: 3D-(3,5/4)-trihydroxycyclohexane-1,2-dione acylhydrolase (decyclizing) [Dermatophilaceae bacterium]
MDISKGRPQAAVRRPSVTGTIRLTVAQAVVRFLARQYSERDGVQQRLIEGCFGIFGHGNIAGLGQALMQLEVEGDHEQLRYFQSRNEQAMVHTAVGFSRMRNRLQTLACTTSVGPGATNLVTGAALATINRIPVLLLPGDVFAGRVSGTVLQQLERPDGNDISVNDTLRPVSVFFDRVWRPEQLSSVLLGAMRALTDPVNTGAVTIALPQDVQAEAWDWPVELFDARVWHVARPLPEAAVLSQAVTAFRASERPLIVAGGGVGYSEATEALRELAEATGVPVAETQAGKGSLPWDHPQSVGAIGATGTTAANMLAAQADLVVGVGTRWSDFTTASMSAFGDPGVRFVSINVAALDGQKLSGLSVVADAREALQALTTQLVGWRADPEYTRRASDLAGSWGKEVAAAYDLGGDPDALPRQSQVIGAVNELSGARDVVVCAAGSMPGDLHKMWRTSDVKGYQVEYGYSCMGYEIAGGLGVKMADPSREVVVMVGDGSYLMMAQELVTAVQEGIKLVVVLVQNHGFASIGSLSETVGVPRFGTSFRYRGDSGRLDGGVLPVDLAANAASLGAQVLRADTLGSFRACLSQALASTRTTVVHVECGQDTGAPSSGSWWDVPVAEVSTQSVTRAARSAYEQAKTGQRGHLTPFEQTGLK